MSELAEHQE